MAKRGGSSGKSGGGRSLSERDKAMNELLESQIKQTERWISEEKTNILDAEKRLKNETNTQGQANLRKYISDHQDTVKSYEENIRSLKKQMK